MDDLKSRFYSKVNKTDTCWLWMAYKNKGYGYMSINNKPKQAYRIAWELERGPIPEGLVVRHQCRSKDCVNPAHLLLGTQADNMKDAIRDGTIKRGEDRHLSKLTNDDVLEFIRGYATYDGPVLRYCREQSTKLGVGVMTLYDITAGKTWTHIWDQL